MYPLSLGPDALEIDGLREDAEVLFILTTNRPDQIEPALASRPRRIDKAIEFTSESALAELAATWPGARLSEIFNSLAGVTPGKKFKDRATGESRIWKAIQTLADAAPAADQPEAVPERETAPMIAEGPATKVPAPAAPQLPDAAPEEVPANNDASPGERRARGRHRRKAAAGSGTRVRRAVAGTAGSEVGCSQECARYAEDGRCRDETYSHGPIHILAAPVSCPTYDKSEYRSSAPRKTHPPRLMYCVQSVVTPFRASSIFIPNTTLDGKVLLHGDP